MAESAVSVFMCAATPSRNAGVASENELFPAAFFFPAAMSLFALI
jgi:hypothetical protein